MVPEQAAECDRGSEGADPFADPDCQILTPSAFPEGEHVYKKNRHDKVLDKGRIPASQVGIDKIQTIIEARSGSFREAVKKSVLQNERHDKNQDCPGRKKFSFGVFFKILSAVFKVRVQYGYIKHTPYKVDPGLNVFDIGGKSVDCIDRFPSEIQCQGKKGHTVCFIPEAGPDQREINYSPCCAAYKG